MKTQQPPSFLILCLIIIITITHSVTSISSTSFLRKQRIATTVEDESESMLQLGEKFLKQIKSFASKTTTSADCTGASSYAMTWLNKHNSDKVTAGTGTGAGAGTSPEQVSTKENSNVELQSIEQCRNVEVNRVKYYYLLLKVKRSDLSKSYFETAVVSKAAGAQSAWASPFDTPEGITLYMDHVMPRLDMKDAKGQTTKITNKTRTEIEMKIVTPKPVPETQSFLGMAPSTPTSRNSSSTSSRIVGRTPFRSFLEVESQVVAPISPSAANCRFYIDRFRSGQIWLGNYWRSASYVLNAYCACLNTPNSGRANTVRGHLQDAIKTANTAGKTTFSTEDIYNDHVRAYRAAGCPCGPASYWAWHGVTNVPLKMLPASMDDWVLERLSCSLVEWSIRIFGSCNGCYVGCCPSTTLCPCVEFCTCHSF